MKKLLLAFIIAIGFTAQATAGVYEMIYDVMAVYQFIGQRHEQVQLEEKKNLALDDLIASCNASHEKIDDSGIISVDVKQMQLEKKMKKIEHSSLYKMINNWRVTDESKKPSLSVAAKLMNNRQMNAQDKMLDKWQSKQPKSMQTMNRYRTNRE